MVSYLTEARAGAHGDAEEHIQEEYSVTVITFDKSSPPATCGRTPSKEVRSRKRGPHILKGRHIYPFKNTTKLMPDAAPYSCSVIYGNFPDTFSFHIHIFAFPFVRICVDKSLASPFQLFTLRTAHSLQK